MPASLILAGIEPGTATVIAAIIALIAATAAYWAPRTRRAAAVERSAAGLDDAQRWELLLRRYEAAAEDWHDQLEDCRAQLRVSETRRRDAEAQLALTRRRLAEALRHDG